MPIYIKCNPDNTPTDWFERTVPLEGRNTKPDSEANGKVFIAEATLVKPPLGQDQVYEGPTLTYDQRSDAGTVTFTVRDKTQQELDDEQRAGDLTALRSAGKDMAVVLIELIDWLLANTAITAADFSPSVRQAYQDLKAIADRVK